MLMHHDNIRAADELSQWRKAPENKNISSAGDDRSPPWTWQAYLYHDGERVVMPSVNLMVAFRTAGAQIILKKQKTFKEMTQSGMCCETEFLEFESSKGPIMLQDVLDFRDEAFPVHEQKVEKLGFALDMRRVRVGQSKHIRVRPRFNSWKVRGTLMVQAKELTKEVVAELFELAGRGGLAEWRPSCRTPGSFGMFTAKVK
jgi:hypothetical protein